MDSFKQYLSESLEITLAIKALQTLSYDAQRALRDWESFHWLDGNLQNQFKAGHGPLVDELTAAFAPVRAYLKSKYGNSIMLYRGLYKANNPEYKTSLGTHFDKMESAVLTSWTNDRKIAEIFANLRSGGVKNSRLRLYPEHSQKEIDDAVARFEKNGYTRYRSKRYKVNRTNPKYFDIWDDYVGYLTDGDTAGFRQHLEDEKASTDEYNSSQLENSTILHQAIPIDNIVWILNTLNCKEFIVRK